MRYEFGGFSLDLDRRLLFRATTEVALRQKSFDVLAYLLAHRGRAVAKNEILDAIWPQVTVTGDSLTQCIHDIRTTLEDDGQQLIRTLPRRGYIFAGEVVQHDENADCEPAPLRTAPSIAILPFANLSSNTEYDHFAQGLSEDLITRLARLKWLFVASRNSSFSYTGKITEARQVASDLGVRYVLNGSVRCSGQRLRISTQLSDTSSGLQVWAERYDGEIADFFAVQDRISHSVVAAIEPKIYVAEHQRFQNQPPESLDAWGFVMKAMPFVWTWGSADEIETAQKLLSRATEIDPNYARANSLLAWTHAARMQLGWADADSLRIARELAQSAVRRDPEDPWAHFAQGYVFMVARDFASAVGSLTEAIALNPSFAFAHLILGCTYGYGGIPEVGLQHLDTAERMSPRDHTLPAIHATKGICHLIGRRFAQAVDLEQKAVALRPHFGTAWRTLAAAAGLSGGRETGEHALAQAKRLQPSLSLEWIEKYHPIVKFEDRALYSDGLRQAGLR